MNKAMFRLTMTAALAALPVAAATAEDWYPYPVQVWEPAFDMDSPRRDADYTPLEKASQAWDICVSFPHMKDAYWLGVDYGVTEEARRLGVRMQVVEAGGYTELNKQISQIEDCVAAGADAVIIGAISLDGLNNVVEEVRSRDIPVIDVINGISSPALTAKSLVSFGEMGAKTGDYLAGLHPAGTDPSRSPGSPARPVQAGSRPEMQALPRPFRAARSNWSRRNTAIPAKRFRQSWSRTPSPRTRIWIISSAPP